VKRSALLVFIVALFCISCRSPKSSESVQQVLSNDSVTVTDIHFYSAAINGLLWYRVIVPNIGRKERLPVLYFLHGIDSDPAQVTRQSDIVKLAAATGLIVVMPSGGYSYYTNAKHRPHARWEDVLMQDLPRDVKARFPVLSGREHTGIAGISMGGYAAIKLGLKHPDVFAFVGDMSGPLDITRRPASLRRWGQTWRIWTIFGFKPSAREDDDVFNLLDNASDVHRGTWFESCGRDDPMHPVNQRFSRRLQERGVSVNLLTTPGGHDWKAWNAAMPALFGAAGKALR
jgi:putative tributyrin esterase